MKKMIYCFILFLALSKPSRAQVAEQDSLALYNLFMFNWGGVPNGPVSGWWPGIVITGDRVTAITSLPNPPMFLQIMLPASFGDLTALRSLTFSGGATLPATLVNLTQLEEVSIGGFSNGSGVTSEINVLFSMPWLKKLTVWGVQNLGGIPAGLGRITNLEYLNFSSNQMWGSIPDSLFNCTKLEYISFRGNNWLTGPIPQGIGRLTKLKYFDLSGFNTFSGPIPDSIGYCTELRVLDLSGQTDLNTFEGEIPASITRCSKLSTFKAYGQWYGANPFFDSITRFQFLDTLSINTTINQTSNVIPPAIGTLPHLTYLSLGGNGIIGPIPAALGNSPSLKYLSLSSPYLNGNIPGSLGNIATLTNLTISGGNISGGIPDSLGNLAQLKSLSISGANISGGIPASLNNLMQLQSLSLSGCSLSGPIPSLNNVPASASINLSSNKFLFDGMEAAEQHFTGAFTVTPQANIPVRYFNNKLSVSAGGTLANNTYKWYRNGALFRTVTGDSTLANLQQGAYYATVNNSIVSSLTLTSNNINVPLKLCPPAGNGSFVCTITGSTYQWQANSGTGYINISDDANFSGTNTQTLQLINLPSSFNGYSFRCLVNSSPTQTFTVKFETSWTGATSSNWEDAANWNCSAIPDSGTDVVIASGSVVLNSNATVRSLFVAPGAILTVSPGVTLTVLH